MADIISIATAVPRYRHRQSDILSFMQEAYQLDATDKRKLAFLYHQSQIETRYSVVPDYSNIEERSFIPDNPDDDYPDIDTRMRWYQQEALPLASEAIAKCIDKILPVKEITHLITVSCTGMSAPGLDLQIVEYLGLSPDIFRTSVNFMGCYAVIHALKMASMICDSSKAANVLVVAVELCTLHFQKEFNIDNAASSLLFGDGAAAVLVSNQMKSANPLRLHSFHSHVDFKGKQDMSWSISSKGFLMTLSSYVPQLIQADIATLVDDALKKSNLTVNDISHWCIHPGGKKILDVIGEQMKLDQESLKYSKAILAGYGNMSSASILFVLQQIMDAMNSRAEPANIFAVAFGPGLTMESFIATR